MATVFRVSSLLSVLFILLSGSLASQTNVISGTVTDSATGGSVAGARIEALSADGAVAAKAHSDSRGRFRLSGLAAQPYTIVAGRLGSTWGRVENITPDGAQLTIVMALIAVELEQVVVSASRNEETALEAPAAVSVVSRRDR